MSSPLPYNLTQQKLRQLLAAARLNRPCSDANADAQKYNWNQPRYFSRNQLELIAAFAQNVGGAFNSAIASLGRSDCTAAEADTTQHFASELLSQLASQPQFLTALAADDNNPCGFISVSAQSARELIAKLLGDSEPHAQQALSGLENSLLQDLASTLIGTLSRSLKQAGCPLLRQTAELTEGNLAFDWPDNCQLCQISFNVTIQNTTAVLHVAVPAAVLEPLTAKTQKAAAAPNQFKEVILNHIRPLPLPITTRVASASLRLSDVLALEEGDIVLLDKPIYEPIEILLKDTPAFEAHLAADEGKYAMVIAPPSPKQIS
jgi:flagellar motor switch protein FliM